jgi:hypothetical protein
VLWLKAVSVKSTGKAKCTPLFHVDDMSTRSLYSDSEFLESKRKDEAFDTSISTSVRARRLA